MFDLGSLTVGVGLVTSRADTVVDAGAACAADLLRIGLASSLIA